MSAPAWLNLQPTACVLLSALVAAGGPSRRAVAGMIATSALAAPFWLPEEWTALRGLCAIVTAIGVFRCFDLVSHRPPTTPLRRVAHVFSAVDSFRLRRAAPTVTRRDLVRIALWYPLAGAARAFALHVAPRADSESLRWLGREAGALVLVLAIAEGSHALMQTCYRVLGFIPPVTQNAPLLSRSIREFWGRRWNRIVGEWLDARFHRPWARRRKPYVGMALAFVVSAVLHVYIALPGLGLRWALAFGAFFVVQGALAALEGPLRLSRWPTPAARTWTIGWMILTSPLFCEAFLKSAERFP